VTAADRGGGGPRRAVRPKRAGIRRRRETLGTRPALRFAGTLVGEGETVDIKLKVAESYTAEPVSIPLTVVRGGAGPTVFITATVHGDELIGVGILRSLLNGCSFADLAGTIVAVPVANVPGFLVLDRRLPDRRDLNRSFPGSRGGSLASRLAEVLFREVVAKSDFGIDLHTAGAERTNYPQVRADLTQPHVASLAAAFGCPLIVDSPGPERSLRSTAVAAGVPTIVYEAGSPLRFERPFIQIGVAGILNVLRSLGMLPGAVQQPPVRLVLRRPRWVRAKVGGIVDLMVELGQPLGRGDPISVHTNPFGRGQSVLSSPHGGLVLGLTQIPLVHPGDAVCHLAPLGARDLASWRRFYQSPQRVGWGGGDATAR
jgi:predicted deacylase